MLRLGASWSLLAIVVVLAVLTGYTAGIHDRIARDEWGRYLFAIASAISANAYGLRGAVYFEPVTDALQEAGLTSDPVKLLRLGASYPDNLSDGVLINKAIQHASDLQLRIPEPAQQTEKYKVRGLANDDPGYAEFVRLSFSIFSPTIESLSLTYLSLFVISAILFIIAMRGDPFYLGLVTLFAAVHYLLFKSNLFGSVGRSPLLGEFADPTISFVTPSSAHFLTVLAILPLFHSLALFCRKVPITFGQAFCLAGQGLIAGFVIYARSSALWVLLAAAFVPLAARLLWGRRETRANGSRTGTKSFFRIVARTGSRYWAVILFLAVAVLTNAGLQTTLHPLYNSGGSVSRHAFWTEVWYGLQYHPDWLHKYGETYKLNGRVALQDDLPVAAVLNYLERHPPPADRQVYDDTGWLRWRVVNDYAFSAFLQFARSDPLFVLQAFQYKLLGNIHKLSWAVVEVFGNRSDLDYALLIFLLLGVAITASRFGQPVESDGWKYLVMAFIAAALSVSPSVATLSRWQLMSDGIYLTSFALLLLMTFMVTALIHRLRFSLLPDRLPLWLMRRPITFATAGGAIRSSKILPIFGCIVIAALLSSAALMLVKRVQAPSSWVVSAAEAPTNLADLPLLSDSRFAWFNIAGINAQVVPGVPLVSAVPMLRLIALDDGVHTLAFRVTGLVKNERYRIAAWVRPQAGANFGIAARDQADNDNGPNNSRAVFDLASRNVLMAKGNGTPGIALAGDWLLVWMDLGTTDGQYVVSFYVCNRDADPTQQTVSSR